MWKIRVHISTMVKKVGEGNKRGGLDGLGKGRVQRKLREVRVRQMLGGAFTLM